MFSLIIVLSILMNAAAQAALKKESKKIEEQWECENKALLNSIDNLLKYSFL